MSTNSALSEVSLQPAKKVTEKIIYLVAGESSGDILGAGLINSLKQYYPNTLFKGIGGPLMKKNGLESLYSYERLSVMGIFPILARLFELLKMRKRLRTSIIQEQADCFIGIDAPVFNTELEYQLTRAGVTCVHYVSPSVWAWRENRIHKIVKSISMMVCLFPFELDIYKKHGLRAVAVGHPLADDIPMQPDPLSARKTLGFKLDPKILAILPGSRASEVQFLIAPFIDAVKKLHVKYPELEFVLPCASKKIKLRIARYLASQPSDLIITLVDGRSREVMLASDLVLLASGTASLEAMLLKKPMVVAYKLSKLSYFIYSRLLKIRNVSLPNLLSGKTLVKEFIQADCTGENLSNALVDIIESSSKTPQLVEEFIQRHKELRLGGNQKAATAIYHLLCEQDKNNNQL